LFLVVTGVQPSFVEEIAYCQVEQCRDRSLPAARLPFQRGFEICGQAPTVDFGLHELHCSAPLADHNFVPLSGQNGTLEIALADPRNLATIDELSLLSTRITEGFALDVVGDEDNPDETLSIDRPAAVDSDIAPVIKLVDTTIFNALERRASDIHIESRDQEVVIKYRIDGVLHYAMPPLAKDWHTTLISRMTYHLSWMLLQ